MPEKDFMCCCWWTWRGQHDKECGWPQELRGPRLSASSEIGPQSYNHRNLILLTWMNLGEDSRPQSPYKGQAGQHLDVGLGIPLSRGISQILSIPTDSDLQNLKTNNLCCFKLQACGNSYDRKWIQIPFLLTYSMILNHCNFLLSL